jgi:hypothetical protein
MKTCKTCKETKPIEEFHRNKLSPCGRRHVCRSCSGKIGKRWRENNPDRVKEYAAVYYEENKERLKPIRKFWDQINPDKLVARTRRYRTKKSKACPDWLTEEQHKEIEEFYWLAKDLRSVTGEEYHVDHIVPLQGKHVCGLHVPWNLQLLPKDLNLRKSNSYED